jgi:hypothetical protein
MSYVPKNAVVYGAAMAGALAALSPGVNAFSATTFANVAQAYAQEFDTLWGTTKASQVDTQSIYGSSFLFFLGKQNGPNGNIRVTANTTNPATYAATCRALITVVQLGQGVVTGFSPPYLFLPPSILANPGSTTNLPQGPVNNVLATSTGSAAKIILPAAPVDGDAVIVHNLGASVSSPTLVTATGGSALENPGDPGNFSAVNGTIALTGQGQCVWWQYQLSRVQWTLLVNS